MITRVIDLLKTNDWINVSETVEIAKGKNELAKDFRIAKRKITRVWQLKK